MIALHRITSEILHLLRVVAEDISEDRLCYRNELRRMTLSSVSLPFSEYEHFLERYGYWSLEQRTDAFTLSQAGELAARGDEQRLKALDDDARYHFQKELENLTPAPAPSMSGQRFDQHYIRFDGVGRGGVGSVWRGEQLKTGRPVAIKTLEGLDELMTTGRKSTLKKKIERVMRAVARLDHPFVTQILDLSVHHTPPYYVMPLCSGGSLRDLLRAGPISPELALNIFAQVCLALEHAHAHGVLHLDLKPENILLDARGNAQVFDFGVSRVVGKQVALAGRQSYVGFGSVAYMAPELLRDPLVETQTVDIYSLGLILYEILVGELPGRRSPMPSAVIKDLPEPIDELFDAMVQDSPQRRPQTMAEVLALLNQVAPFDRLSQNSMSIIFNAPPVPLPGLTSVALPEPEVSASRGAVGGGLSAAVAPEPPVAPEPSLTPVALTPAAHAVTSAPTPTAPAPTPTPTPAPAPAPAPTPAPAPALAPQSTPTPAPALTPVVVASQPLSLEVFAQTPTPTRGLDVVSERRHEGRHEGRDEERDEERDDEIDDIEIEEVDLITHNPSRAHLLAQIGDRPPASPQRSRADGSSSGDELMSSAPLYRDLESTRPLPTLKTSAPLPSALPSALGARALAGLEAPPRPPTPPLEPSAAEEDAFDDSEKTALHDTPTPERREPSFPAPQQRATLPPIRAQGAQGSQDMAERLKQRFGSR